MLNKYPFSLHYIEHRVDILSPVHTLTHTQTSITYRRTAAVYGVSDTVHGQPNMNLLSFSHLAPHTLLQLVFNSKVKAYVFHAFPYRILLVGTVEPVLHTPGHFAAVSYDLKNDHNSKCNRNKWPSKFGCSASKPV